MRIHPRMWFRIHYVGHNATHWLRYKALVSFAVCARVFCIIGYMHLASPPLLSFTLLSLFSSLDGEARRGR